MKKRIAIILCFIFVFSFAACGLKESVDSAGDHEMIQKDNKESTNDDSGEDGSAVADSSGATAAANTVSGVPKSLVADYLSDLYGQVYWAEDSATEPQDGDFRIDEFLYAAEKRTYETVGVAFLVRMSHYRDGNWRNNAQEFCLVLGKGLDDAYDEVRGMSYDVQEATLENTILSLTYGAMDIDATLWRDGYPSPVGPGCTISFFRDVYDGEPDVEVLDGWEPIYETGDYWLRKNWEGFSALCYHSNTEEKDFVYSIEATRTDLFTYRGIRVGSSRDEVLSAYPELFDMPYWEGNDMDFPSEDYLWYCKNANGFGAALLFFFTENKVSEIRLYNMFD